jgi:hypothetical protein
MAVVCFIFVVVHAYKVLNSSITSEFVVAFIMNDSKLNNHEMNNCEGTSLYELIKVGEEMVLLVLKGLGAITK